MAFATPAILLSSIPTASQCLEVLAPILAVILLRWIVVNLDQWIARLFPSLQWQKEMGWLNLRAERRAATVLRWLAYAVQAALGAALGGIVWGAVALRDVVRWSEPDVLGNLLTRLPVLIACVTFWLLYLFIDLLPRLCREHEAEELEKFRAEEAEREAREKSAGPRTPAPFEIWSKSPFPPRSNSRR